MFLQLCGLFDLYIDCIIIQPTYIIMYTLYNYYIYSGKVRQKKTKNVCFEVRVPIGCLVQSIVLIGWR